MSGICVYTYTQELNNMVYKARRATAAGTGVRFPDSAAAVKSDVESTRMVRSHWEKS